MDNVLEGMVLDRIVPIKLSNGTTVEMKVYRPAVQLTAEPANES